MKKQQQEKKEVEEDSATSESEAEEMADDDASSSSDDGSDDGSSSDGSGDDSGGSEAESDADSSDDGSGDRKLPTSHANSINGSGEQCTFDLANLLVTNTHQINAAELYQQNTTNKVEWYNDSPTISTNTNSTSSQLLPIVNESLLLAKAAEGTTQLLRELWKLPTEKKTDVGPLARLPSAEVKLPRSLPPPPPKQLSKWEQFALQRGIAPKSKRSRKVYDESTGEWKHLTGSLESKANAGPESWPILEVKKNDDPNADPWEKLREEKKGRVNKNVEARMRNAERAGTLERGSANRMVKNNERLEKQRDIAKEKERQRGLVAPVGVPLDVKSDVRRGKPSTQLALRATQVSTASLGKFDKQREGEPEKKLSSSIHGNKKRKKELLDGSGGKQSEAQKSAAILQRVMNGSSSKEKERDVKRGKYARGETAYDYDYDDGLGASSFKKKKGRAGMGKIRKFTKKRIK